jgi:hypothetical protein
MNSETTDKILTKDLLTDKTLTKDPTNKDTTDKIALEINDILNNNKITDLKKFLARRNFLNKSNSYMIYLFYIVQYAGILVTSISASINDQRLIWLGIGLNIIASIIQIYEKINNDQMKKLFVDIQSIKNGTYIDETPLIDIESLNQLAQQQPQPSQKQFQSSQMQYQNNILSDNINKNNQTNTSNQNQPNIL